MKCPPRKFFLIFSIFFILSLIATPVSANDQTLFGPKDLKIKKWGIHFSFPRFNVDDPGEGVLVATKQLAGQKDLRGFSYLNGRYISIRDFLRGHRGVTLKVEKRKKKEKLKIPVVKLRSKPSSIARGKFSILSWKSKSADECIIEPGNRSVSDKGSEKVWPTKTTTYTLTCSRPEGIAEASVIVQVKNAVPEADPQSVTTYEDTSVPITLTGSDADGDALIYKIVSGPGHGSLSGTPPDLTYTPHENYSGGDSFSFKANDGLSDSNSVTVSLTIIPISVPHEDSDNDGVFDYIENKLGTDPQNTDSVPRVKVTYEYDSKGQLKSSIMVVEENE